MKEMQANSAAPNMIYDNSARAHLFRARALLDSGKSEELFYAAFELRCCIEARQADYLEAIDWYNGQRVKAWKLGETSKKLQRLWRDPKISKLTFSFPDRSFETYYTPIRPQLVRKAEKKLGALLHADRSTPGRSQSAIREIRTNLIQVWSEAAIACRGEHIAPPLMDYDTGEVHPFRFYPSQDTAELSIRLLLSKGAQFTLGVDYLDNPPEEWGEELAIT